MKKNKIFKYNAILKNIAYYKKIAIFRHIHPDFDSLSAVQALKEFIHYNFKNKEIKIFGDDHDELISRLSIKTNKVSNNWFKEKFLAIIVDTPNKRRISDPRWQQAELKIKIDHHPYIEKIGKLEYIDKHATSACEILAELFFYSKLKISKKCATWLYIGIVGDSGRFQYQNTSIHTFLIAQKLIQKKINLNEIYKLMYLRKQNNLKVMAHILNNYRISPNGVAYYILYNQDLKKLGININQGKEYINLFHYIDGIKIWCAITEDFEEKCFRVSIRSDDVDIHNIANTWRGGGHIHASGARLINVLEIDKFINDLDKLITD